MVFESLSLLEQYTMRMQYPAFIKSLKGLLRLLVTKIISNYLTLAFLTIF